MKTFIAICTISIAFLLMSCSNVEQDLSPVAPEIQKISAPEGTGTFPYLTSFYSVPVKGFSALRDGEIEVEVVVGDLGWPKDVVHIYALLEYELQTVSSQNKMVFLEKPISNIFKLKGFNTVGLKNVKVYCYSPVSDILFEQPYPQQQSFNNIEIQWSANYKGIQILLSGTAGDLGDSFVEITTSEGSFVTFIDEPQSEKIFIPRSGPAGLIETTDVNLFSLLK